CFDSIPRVEYNTRLSYLSPSGTSQILSKNLSYDLRPYHFRASVLPLFHTSHFGMLYRTAQNLIQYHDIYSVSRIYARETQFARERLSRYQRRVRSIVGDMHPYVFAQVSEFVALMQFPQIGNPFHLKSQYVPSLAILLQHRIVLKHRSEHCEH